uniref:Uncharacterized protein n=1 Tax=Strigamia maritima TaxID=126957 RepID=T1IHY9_STRMM
MAMYRCSERVISHFEGFTKTNNRLEGHGVVYFVNGSSYDGHMSSGTLHGQGKYAWKDGVVYKGDFENGRISGKGRYEWPDGSWYSGQVKNGRKHGHGSYCDGTQFGRLDYNAEGTWYYSGEWADGKRNGCGVQHFESGSIYNGEWRDGFAHGLGTMYSCRADQLYEGMWRRGQRHGHGEQYWLMEPSPSVCLFQHHMYKGEWVNDKRSGFGIFIYADGSKYEGYWKDDRKSGNGIFFHKNGARFTYDFDEDKIIAKVEVNGRKAIGPFHVLKDDGVLLFCPDLDMALPDLDEYDWKPEKQIMRNLILSKITSLRSIYYVYSGLGKTTDSISAGVLDCMRFLQMCRDVQLDRFGWSLGRVMNALKTGSNRINWAQKKLIPWKFVRKLIILSYRLFNDNCNKKISAVNCFNLFITNHIERWSKEFHGVLFADPDRTPFIIDYIDSMCSFYQRVCAAYQSGDQNKNISARHFLWFIKETGLLGVGNLRIKNLVALLANLMPCFKTDGFYDFDLEMTFLDFIDSILLIGDAFYSDLTLSQSKEICGRYTLTESSEKLFKDNIGKQLGKTSVSKVMYRILLFKDMIPATLTQPSVHVDNKILTRAKDKSILTTETDRPDAATVPGTISQSETSSSEGNLYTNVMRHFSFDKLGDLTGTQERDIWVFKLRRFLDHVFLPVAHIWMVIHAKMDWERHVEADLAAVESFSNIILPDGGPSTIWFDESVKKMEDAQHGLLYRVSSRNSAKPVMKLHDGGCLITTHNPHYMPSASIPGYTGHCPGYNFRAGKTHADNFGLFEKDEREEMFQNGFKLKPGTVLSYNRKPMQYLHRRGSARLTQVDYSRYERTFNFYEKAQEHRDSYRDLTGTLAKIKRFQVPKQNREAWKPQYPFDSYYLHHNRAPDSKVNFFDRFHPSRLYAPRPPLNYDSNPLKHLLYSTQ